LDIDFVYSFGFWGGGVRDEREENKKTKKKPFSAENWD
jgi:hypothetical protein